MGLVRGESRWAQGDRAGDSVEIRFCKIATPGASIPPPHHCGHFSNRRSLASDGVSEKSSQYSSAGAEFCRRDRINLRDDPLGHSDCDLLVDDGGWGRGWDFVHVVPHFLSAAVRS